MIILELFWAFFQIGLFSIGGGYAALPLIQQQVVQTYGWLDMAAFSDVITISQMTPGPIAINAATFVGIRIAGVIGSVVATLGCVLPSLIIVLVLAMLYKRYRSLRLVQGVLGSLQPAVVGLIASAGVSIIAHTLWNGELFAFRMDAMNWVAVALVMLCLLLLRRCKLNPMLIMLGAGIIGGAVYTLL